MTNATIRILVLLTFVMLMVLMVYQAVHLHKNDYFGHVALVSRSREVKTPEHHQTIVHTLDEKLFNMTSKRVLCLGGQSLDDIVKDKRRQGALAVGVDPKRGISNGHVLAGSLASQGIAEGSVDVIFLYSFESILSDKKFLRQTSTLLAPDGSLVIEIEEDPKTAGDMAVSESKGRVLASLYSEYQVVRSVRKATDFDKETFVWSIICSKLLGSGPTHNLRTTTDSVLVLGHVLSDVSKKASELRRSGYFVVAMIPDAPPNSGLLRCSKDIGSIFFGSVIVVGDRSKVKCNDPTFELGGKRVICLGSQNLVDRVKELRAKGALAVGVDPGVSYGSGHVLHGELADAGFAEGSVDLVFSNTFEQILNDKNFVYQVAAVLASNGVFILKVPQVGASVNATERAMVLKSLSNVFHTRTIDSMIVSARLTPQRAGLPSSPDRVLVLSKTSHSAMRERKKLAKEGVFAIAMSQSAFDSPSVLGCASDLKHSSFSKVLQLERDAKTCVSKVYKCAYVSLVRRREDLVSANVLSTSIRANSAYPVVFAVPANVDEEVRQKLVKDSVESATVIDIEPIRLSNRGRLRESQVNVPQDYGIIRLWSMTHFETLILLDINTVVSESLDNLCVMKLGAQNVAAPGGESNSRMMVLKPSQDTYRRMRASVEAYDAPLSDFDGFLKNFFDKNDAMKKISLKSKLWGSYSRLHALNETKHAIHLDRIYGISPHTYFDEADNHPYKIWHSYYDKWRATKQYDMLNAHDRKNPANEEGKQIGATACILYVIHDVGHHGVEGARDLLKSSVRTLEKHFFPTGRYSICIVHNSLFKDDDIEAIASKTKSQVLAYQADFEYELGSSNSPESDSTSYSMYNFFTHPVFQDFDYILRLDFGLGIDSSIPCNPFDVMKANNYWFGYYVSEKQDATCSRGIEQYVADEFLPSNYLQLHSGVDPGLNYQKSFSLFKTSLFRQPIIQKLLVSIDDKGYTCDFSSMEQIVVAYAVSLGLHREMIHQFSGYDFLRLETSSKLWENRLHVHTVCKHPPDEWSSYAMPNEAAACTPQTPIVTGDHSYTRVFRKAMLELEGAKCTGEAPAPLFQQQPKLVSEKEGSNRKKNLVILYIASLSRAHAARSIPKSLNWLRHHDAVSLGRFHATSLGIEDDGNEIALISGSQYGTKRDDASYLWNHAKRLGYLTQYTSSGYAGIKEASSDQFDYWNVQSELEYDKNRGFCRGDKQASEVALQATLDFFEAHEGMPKFSLAYFGEQNWARPVSKAGVYASFLDAPILHFLENLPERKQTHIIVMSNTGSFHKEQQLLDPHIVSEHRFPLSIFKLADNENVDRLKENIWRLTTPYDVHTSLLNIMGGDSQSKHGENLISTAVNMSRSCIDAGITVGACNCKAAERMDPPPKVVDAALDYINSRGHRKYPLICQKLSFLKLQQNTESKAANFRSVIAPNENVYYFNMQTDFGRVFECSVFQSQNKANSGENIHVYSIRQKSYSEYAYACSPSLVPSSIDFCACEQAFGISDTKFERAIASAPPGKNLVMTSFFTHKKDPQRGKVVTSGFQYIRNFYISLRALQINAVVFHTGIPENVIENFQTEKIHFVRIHEPEASMSTNDYRFKVYMDYIQNNAIDIDWILLTDASDVFFNRNPFTYMTSHQDRHALFMSPDIGTFKSNGWMKNKLKKCYKGVVENWKSEWHSQLHNAGVWGGNRDVMECMLKCVWDNLRHVTKGRGNCNMPAVNYCSHFGNCLIEERTLDDFSIPLNPLDREKCEESGKSCGHPRFVNPFRSECYREHAIVHNKCGGSKAVKCVEFDKKSKKLVKKKDGPCRKEKAVLGDFGVTVKQPKEEKTPDGPKVNKSSENKISNISEGSRNQTSELAGAADRSSGIQQMKERKNVTRPNATTG